MYKRGGNSAMVVVLRTPLFSVLRVCVFLGLIFCDGTLSGDNEKWLPYDTMMHKEMGANSEFSRKINDHLVKVKKYDKPKLRVEYDRWNAINLGHVFEEAMLSAYGILKNNSMFNGRIPDGVEDGMIDQLAQYTIYPNSTFIEVKYMREISFSNNRIKGQIRNMINYLSYEINHKTTPRTSVATFFPLPGKASEEELAILVFITPSNCKVGKEIIDYADSRQVKLYQMTPF